MQVVVAIPVKPFDAAKSRLSAVLSAAARREVGMELARRTIAAAGDAGTDALVLAADAGVANWARSLGVNAVVDEGSDLNTAVRTATGGLGDWMVCHADLPLLTAGDIGFAAKLVSQGRAVIAPSSDGGTTLLGGAGRGFEFSYGSGSFHRHLRRLDDPLILTTLGLGLDLDGPDDLEAAVRHQRGRWLADLLASDPK